ncbi:hypothetical protein FVEG_08765 [Fusarium verticillioides 7600]|uniref:Uncharacterized protein n=1 Tax=Gibberella moniliformis (strain M3125 / FGSC 7600) TaxID=334819 RepID=W7MCE7_GIBM7|nr:hypothetical protein FVEG_08765 [Fusarium verticillioides 7600]EWG49168.1 hypothetical protein FVEG_08765 [Fusarium verticillioides 7600]
MGVHDEDGERQLSGPPGTREELTSLLTKAFVALAKDTGNPLGIVALGIHAEGRPKHQIQIKSKLEERSAMKNMKLFALASAQLNLIDWDRPDIAHVLVTVTSLNTNISTLVFAFKDRREEWEEAGDTDWLERVTNWTVPQIRAEAENERNFTGLARLVQKCFQFPNWKILEYVSELPSLPKLNRLTLRFQLTKESIVLNLLKRTRHGELFIGPMWLDPGYFRPIFEFCSSPESNMQKLEVRASLYQMGSEERGQIHFHSDP